MLKTKKRKSYLTDIPPILSEYGLCKTLAVRREVIHIKHIMTEVFVRKSIDIQKYLDKLDISLFDYMTYLTNRLRNVHHFTRDYTKDCDEIVKSDRDRFFPTQQLYEGLNTCIVLDFDGVVTEKKFHYLYELCCERNKTLICSANPMITPDWFHNKGLTLPHKINSMKGKVAKIRRLIEIQQKHDYVFYVDNEPEYLEFAWLFGIQTFHYTKGEIKYFSLKTK